MFDQRIILTLLPLLHQKQKTMVIQEKWEEGWASLKPVLHPSMHDSFLARVVFLIWGNMLSSRQIVTCKQHFLVTTFFCKSHALNTVSSHLSNVYFCISKVTSTFSWAESTKRALHSCQRRAMGKDKVTPSLGIIGVDHGRLSISIYIYIYIHCIQWYIYIQLYIHIYIYIQLYIHIYTIIYTYIYNYIYIYIQWYIYIYNYIYIYIYTIKYIHIYIYTIKYTHIYIQWYI